MKLEVVMGSYHTSTCGQVVKDQKAPGLEKCYFCMTPSLGKPPLGRKSSEVKPNTITTSLEKAGLEL